MLGIYVHTNFWLQVIMNAEPMFNDVIVNMKVENKHCIYRDKKKEKWAHRRFLFLQKSQNIL